MKSTIFTNAWKLFRTFGINLSTALSIAWKEFKIEVLADKINELELKLSTPELREEIKNLISKIKPLNIVLNSIKPILNVAFDNSGARHDYGIGAYNGD